jgi:YYY domain-containing protein
MFSDSALAETLRWWLAVEAVGLMALPIALLVFRRLPGCGYAFTKPMGLLLAGYLFWLALSLHVLPNRPGSIVWILMLIAAADVYLLRRWGSELRQLLEERLGFVVAVEVVFGVTFVAAAYLRSFVPEISGTEKPMDFMLLNTASRSRFYPPDDAWLSGFGVSYYYFGYVIQAMVAKLAAVQTAVAFNLALASTAALAATAAFGLAWEIARLARGVAFRAGVAVGLTALLLVAVIGNLEGVLEFGVANGVISGDTAAGFEVPNIETARQSSACLLGAGGVCIEYPNEESSYWWWWRATRLSGGEESIREFPFFSFLLGDLHPHVMAIPFALTVVGLGLAFWRSEGRLRFATWRRQPALLIVTAVLVGGLGFLNTWDLPTFGALVAALVLGRNLAVVTSNKEQVTSGEEQGTGNREHGGPAAYGALRGSLGFLLPLGVLAVVLYAPFYLSFSSQASGLEAVTGPATLPLHSALFWGPLLVVNLPLPLALLASAPRAWVSQRLLMVGMAALALLLVWLLVVLVNEGAGGLRDALEKRGSAWLTTLFFGTALIVCMLALWQTLVSTEEDRPLLAPVLAAMTLAILLILGGELFFIRDVFGTRMNTVFKLSYQAWLLLGISGAVSAFWLLRQPERGPAGEAWRGLWAGVAALVIAGALLYPLGATLSRTEGLAKSGQTLDGLAQARRDTPEDVATAEWLRRRAGENERIVEATGGQYSQAGRLATWSGVPTVIGWPGHEVQWGREGQSISAREAEVNRAYDTESLAEAEAILRKYGVTYVYIGRLERAKYAAAGLEKFATGLPNVLRVGESALYRLLPEGTGTDAAAVEESR